MPDEIAEYQLGQEYRLQPRRRLLLRNGEPVSLPAKAYDVLVLLVQQHHRPVGKDELLERVWGVAVSQNSLNQCITALRRAFHDTRQASQYIGTIPNVGYQFVATVTPMPVVAPAVPEPVVRRPSFPFSAWRVAAAIAVVATLAGAYWRATRVTSIGIAPYVNLQRDDAYDWLSDSLMELAAARLPDAVVRLPAASAEPPRELPSAAELSQLLNRTGAGYLLVGSYSIPAKERILVRLTVFRRHGEPPLASVEAAGALEDFAAIGEDALRRALEAATGKPVASSPPPMERYAAGIAAWRRGDLTGAACLLRRAVATNPRDPLLLSALGALLDEMGYVGEAALLHRKAVERADSLPPSSRILVEARYHLSRAAWDQAIADFTRIHSSQPDDTGAAIDLAAAQFRARRTIAAQATLDALTRLEGVGGPDARVLLLAARIQGQLGDMERTRQLAAQSAETAGKQGNRLLEARALLLQAGASQNLGRSDATPLRSRARAACEALGDTACLGAAWRVEGNAALGFDKVKQAVACYRKAFAMARRAGNPRERLNIVNGLGNVLIRGGQYRQAEEVYRGTLKSDLRADGLEPSDLSNMLAVAVAGQGRLAESAVYAAEAIAHGKASGNQEMLAHGYLNMAVSREMQPSAQPLYEKAIRLFEAVANPELHKAALLAHAHYLVSRGHIEKAELLVAQAEVIEPAVHRQRLAEVKEQLLQARTDAKRKR